MRTQTVKPKTHWPRIADVKSASIWLIGAIFFVLASACLPA
jgi:hypothetical protein